MHACAAAQRNRVIWRLFIAVELDDAARRLFVAGVDACREAGLPARWVDPRLAHLTVVFLGEVAVARTDAIAGVLAAVAARHRAFTVTTGPLGAFPTERRPRVIYVGIADPAERLGRLALELADAVRELGVPVNRRPFHPHLTIGRVRAGAGVSQPGFDAARAAFGHVSVAAIPVRELCLIRSELSRDGALYTTLATAPLSTAG